MNKRILFIGFGVLIIGIAAGFYLWSGDDADAPGPKVAVTENKIILDSEKPAEQPGPVTPFSEGELKALDSIVSLQETEKVTADERNLLVSPQELLEDLENDRKVRLVDIRASGDFNKCRISESLNIPLYSIKTKQFLISIRIVLIATGHETINLVREAAKLRESGFSDVRVLDGGLVHWRDVGGKVEGDFFAIDSLDEITPKNFHLSAGQRDWEIVCLTGRKQVEDLKAQYPGILFFSEEQPLEDLKKLKVLEGRNQLNVNDTSYLLVVNENGEISRKIKEDLRDAGLVNSYYLVGGLQGYGKYLAMQSAMKQPGEVSIEKCETCP